MTGKRIDRRVALGILGASGYSLLARQAISPSGASHAFDIPRESLKSFTKGGQDVLLDILNSGDFRGEIPAARSEELQKLERKTAYEVMLDLLPVAQVFARPPISNFRVGAVVRGNSGDLYLGANLEIPGQALSFSVHAEQAASSNAYMHGADAIMAIALTGAPCGHCRQFLEELSPGGDINLIVRGSEPIPLKSLLPSAFGPSDLGLKHGALPIERVKIDLIDRSPDSLARTAVSAARISYAPYTKAHSGVAMRLSDGSVHSGTYIENAAFNPSLPPLQAAFISALNARKALDQIEDVVLVELDTAVISQYPVFEVAVRSVSPKARVRRVVGRKAS